MEDLLPQEDAAKRLGGISPRTLERWRVTGQGPEFVKIGKRTFYTESALAEFVERNRRTSTSAQPAA